MHVIPVVLVGADDDFFLMIVKLINLNDWQIKKSSSIERINEPRDFYVRPIIPDRIMKTTTKSA